MTRLLEALPEFRLDYETSDARPTEPGEVLVEDLAADGDDAVVNAVWVSLIEWFAWGSDGERAALEAADPLQGPKTKAIRTHYRDPPRSTDEIRATRVRRSTSAILLVGGVVIGLAGVVDGD